jgi:hemolysin activation/secretion protein
MPSRHPALPKPFPCLSLLAGVVVFAFGAQVPVAQAQGVSAASSAPAASPVFAIRGFNVKGANPLSEGATSQVLAPFLRNDATLETLQKATATLEAALRDAGFGLHRVSLPPQNISDTVTLEIVKFTIGQVVVTGNQHFDEANIRASLPELTEGASPNFRRMAVQTALANDNPSRQLSISLKESVESDKIDATVQVRDSRPWTAGITLANSGNESSGQDRFTLSLGHNNLFNRDHQFVLAHTTSLERPGDVKQWGLNYKIPLYSARGSLALSYTKSDVLGSFGSFNSTGVGSTKGINHTAAFEPEGGRRSYLSVSLDDKLFGASLINGVAVGVDRRSRPVSVNYLVRTEADTSFLAYNLELAFNTSSGRANSLAAYQSEYLNPVTGQGISTRAFKIARAGLSYSFNINKEWLLSLRGQLQMSPDALIAGEQMGLGGVSSLRGAPDRAITGDSGLQTSLEINSPELGKGLRVLGFMDAGWLSNRNADNQRRVGSDRLASAGVGLRYSSEAGISIQADYGRLLSSSKLPLTSNSSAPQKGDDKLHLSVSIRF